MAAVPKFVVGKHPTSTCSQRITAFAPPMVHTGLKDESALLRHEVAYCLGQRQDPAAISTLITILSDAAEHPM